MSRSDEAMMLTVEDAGRLRRVLVETHDVLTVALGAIERSIHTIEASWPEIGPTGRVGQPGSDDDDSDEDGAEPCPYDDLTGQLAAAVQAARALQPPALSFPADMTAWRALLQKYDTQEQ